MRNYEKGFTPIKSGFTLVELMIVLGIMVVLGTFGIAGFNSFNKLQIVQNAANEMITTFNLARSRAQSQVKLCSSPSQTLEGYGIDLNTVDGSYTLNVRCSGVYPTPPIQIKKLPENVSFTNTPITSFFFPVIKGGVSDAGSITLSGYGINKTVAISPYGGISLQIIPTVFPSSTPTPTPFPTSTPIPTATPIPTPTLIPTPSPTPTFRYVFISSQSYNGNMGGLSGADAKCQSLAANAGLTGIYKAWLSDSNTSAASRLSQSLLPYKRVDGVIVANNWSDLADGSIQNPINKTEANTTFSPNSVDANCPAYETYAGYTQYNVIWTNTLSNGNKTYSDPNQILPMPCNINCVTYETCNNWTSSSANYNGALGDYTSSTSYWTYRWTPMGFPCDFPSQKNMSCANSFPIYCIQQ